MFVIRCLITVPGIRGYFEISMFEITRDDCTGQIKP